MNINTHNVYFGLLSNQRGHSKFLLMTNFLSTEAQRSLAEAIAGAFSEDGYDLKSAAEARLAFGRPSVRNALAAHPLMRLFGDDYVGTLIDAACDTIVALYKIED